MSMKMTNLEMVNYLNNVKKKNVANVLAVAETATPYVTPKEEQWVEELVKPEDVVSPSKDVKEEPVEEKKHKKKSKLTPTPAQGAIINEIKEWYKIKGYAKYELAGYAGVGKSTIVDIILDDLPVKRDRVRLCAPTGTASLVLRDKAPGYESSTYHKLFYTPSKDDNGRLVFAPSPEKVMGVKLVIMDESSMVGKKNALEIIEMCRKAGCKLLVVGDRGQLSPVGQGNESFFFINPDALLTEVLRQAADNPIIALSMAIRQATENGAPYRFQRRQQIMDNKIFILPRTKVGVVQFAKVIRNGGVIIAGTNKTRQGLNQGIRNQLGFTANTLMEGETVLMKDNLSEDSGEIPVTNGMRGTATNIRQMPKGIIKFTFTPEKFSGSRDIEVHEDVLFERKTAKKLRFEHFKHYQQTGEQLNSGSEVWFGYCITGHASQGSQWNTVYAIDESHVFNRGADGYIEQNRWIYTVVTRAAENLVICY